MALNGCINGLAMTAVLALLLFPAQYYVPELYPGSKKLTRESLPVSKPVSAKVVQTWFHVDFPPLDFFLTVSLFLLTMITYLCDWIQRKLMEKRLQKLKQYLCDCLERLRTWDNRQEQLEATLQVVQNATSEYNLLLHLMLRHHRVWPTEGKQPSHVFHDKQLECL